MQGKAKEKQNGHKGMIIFVLFLVGAAVAVYFIGAVKVGNFISDQIVMPVVSWVTGGQTTSENEEEDVTPNSPQPDDAKEQTVTSTFEIPEISVYALQAGVFSEQENADTFAESLQQKGGAGYILEEEGSYRVMIAGYLTQEEAENVKDRLESEQSMETKVFPIEAGKLSVEMETTEEAAEVIKTCIAPCSGYVNEMATLALSLDKNETTLSKAQDKIQEMLEEVEKNKNMVDEIAENTDNDSIQSLKMFYHDTAKSIQAVLNQENTLAFSAKLKEAYLGAGVDAANISQAFESDAA